MRCHIRIFAGGAIALLLTTPGFATLLGPQAALAQPATLKLELPAEVTWSPSGQSLDVLADPGPVDLELVQANQGLADLIPPNISIIYGPDSLEELGINPVADTTAVFAPHGSQDAQAPQMRARTPGVLYGGIGGLRGKGFRSPGWAGPEHEELLREDSVLPPAVPVFPRQPGDLPWKALEYQLSSVPGSAAGRPAIEYDADSPDALDYSRSP